MDQVTWKGLCTILVASMATLLSDMILYFVLKWVYGTLVSLTVLEVKTKITLHNNNVLPINCCGCNKQFLLHLVYILLFELLVILAFVV